MMRDLRELIGLLRKENELLEISAAVDPYLELAEIHRRVIDEGGPALLFTNVRNSPFPVVTNLFGTARRVELAFGTRPEQWMRRLTEGVHDLIPPRVKRLWQEKDLLFGLAKVGLKTVPANQAPVLQVCRKHEPLAPLPALTCWQEDGGPFVTLPLVYTEHPDEGSHNLGMYRMQVYDGWQTGMHWQIHKGGGFHYHVAESRNEPLPVTVYLGGPPALIVSSIAPVPEYLPELLLASFIIGEKLAMTEDPLGGKHKLVANAEFAICGHVPPHTRRAEGPFGDHYGYYSLTHDFPILQVERMWHRKDAIYPATIVGKPRQEDYYLGEFLQRLLSPAFPMAMPGVRDLWTYAETGFHPLAAAVVRESYAREAMVSAFRIYGEGQLSLTKFLIITDQTVDLARFADLLETVLARFNPQSDLFIFNHVSQDTLDYTGRKLNHGSKAVMLGVGDPIRTLPKAVQGDPIPGIRQMAVFAAGCLVVSGPDYDSDPAFPEQLLEYGRSRLQEWPLIILADDASIAANQSDFLWAVFTRFNPATDLYAQYTIRDHHLHYQLPLLIDARMKKGYPQELEPREDIVKLVSERWGEYFDR